MVEIIATFTLDFSENIKYFNICYIRHDELLTQQCFYNEVKEYWEVKIENFPNNTLYYFQTKDNYFLNPSNPIIHQDGKMYYSVYTEKPKTQQVNMTASVTINNQKTDGNITPTVFVNDAFISLSITLHFNKMAQTTAHILTIEWISPEETYYIMDNHLLLEKGSTKVQANPHLRIDPTTMKIGIWHVRILVSNILVQKVQFKLSTISYFKESW
jgi:hypothetical protein